MGVAHLLPLLGANLGEGEEGTLFSKFELNLGDTYIGPFENLLTKIDEGQLTLMDLSLTDITSAFLDFLNTEKELNINAAAEFLFIAAYLLELKARSLLPAPKQEEELIEEVEGDLLSRLEQYKTFKEIADHLKQKREYFKAFHERKHLVSDVVRPIKLVNVELRDLVSAFSKVWQELEKRGEVREIAAETITIEDKIKEVTDLLLLYPEGFDFKALFGLAPDFPQMEQPAEPKRFSYLEVIVTFLAILELAKRRIICIVQGNSFGEIKILGAIKA